MKKIIAWISIITIIVLVLDLGIIGLKIFNNNYDIILEGYIGRACFLILPVCAIFRLFTERCPHCGKMKIAKGKYCPYCGEEM